VNLPVERYLQKADGDVERIQRIAEKLVEHAMEGSVQVIKRSLIGSMSAQSDPTDRRHRNGTRRPIRPLADQGNATASSRFA
jgi:hypothetical protein